MDNVNGSEGSDEEMYVLSLPDHAEKTEVTENCCRRGKDASFEEEEFPGVMSLACLVFLRRRLFLLPIITAAWIIASFFISYAVALNSGTVEPFFPYISYTAIDAPERCIFGQLINIGALLLGMNVWIRYLYLKEIFQLKKVPSSIRWQRINIAGITLGILSALGISMVANFQTVVLRIPHYFGAGLAFILGTAYIWIQTLLSWKLRVNHLGSRNMFIAQFVNSIALTIFLLTFAVSKTVFKIGEINGDGTKWTSNLRGFYLTSTITEWLVATSVLTFTLTFTKDFRAIELESPRVKVNFDKIEQKSAQVKQNGTHRSNPI